MTRRGKDLRQGKGRRIATAMLLASVAVAVPVMAPVAMAPQRQGFAIAPQPLSGALVCFGQARGLQIFFDERVVAGRHSPGVSGTLGNEAALTRRLSGPGWSIDSITRARSRSLPNRLRHLQRGPRAR